MTPKRARQRYKNSKKYRAMMKIKARFRYLHMNEPRELALPRLNVVQDIYFFKAKTVRVDGASVMLFPESALAFALSLDSETVRRWASRGILPQSDRSGHRRYTLGYMMVVRVALRARARARQGLRWFTEKIMTLLESARVLI